ncbi:transmembrane emp24 domain-containing protein p24beta2-like isoform X2 [Miscanthus floridulus]|uniref:transmembrane emp24 domain-containing protein p24beta2-like isoform X2 n=1 Tax=Miscanthus floridulus TaxID=154761 RepID=UPI0034587303
MGATSLGLDAFLLVICLVPLLHNAAAIRFVIDREECFSHNVDYQGDTVHVSFVVIKAETPWHYTQDGVDLVVKNPTGDQIYDSRDKTSDKFEFIAQKRGVHRFCFTNKSPYHETVDFDVHVGHFSYFDQHAKDEHFGPLFEQIAKLDEALYNIQFEQHWLEAQTDRQAISVQTAWRVGNDAVEAGSNLVPGSVPRPIARIGVAFAAVAVALFLVKSVVSTASLPARPIIWWYQVPSKLNHKRLQLAIE